jgi:two-component system sensor histidine kinase RegB
MLRHGGEPFRSTSKPGEGLGLGLFFVKRLAAAAGGDFSIDNNPGGGAVVALRLPLSIPDKRVK